MIIKIHEGNYRLKFKAAFDKNNLPIPIYPWGDGIVLNLLETGNTIVKLKNVIKNLHKYRVNEGSKIIKLGLYDCLYWSQKTNVKMVVYRLPEAVFIDDVINEIKINDS